MNFVVVWLHCLDMRDFHRRVRSAAPVAPGRGATGTRQAVREIVRRYRETFEPLAR